MDTKQAGRLGGIKRMQSLTKEERHILSVNGNIKRWNNPSLGLGIETETTTQYGKPRCKFRHPKTHYKDCHSPAYNQGYCISHQYVLSERPIPTP